MAWAKQKIRVIGILPGWVRTDMVQPLFADPARVARAIVRMPMGRFAEPEEIRRYRSVPGIEGSTRSWWTGAFLPDDGISLPERRLYVKIW